MPLLTKALQENGFSKASSGTGYFNPSSVKEGDEVRFTILGDQSATGYELWMDSSELGQNGLPKGVKTRFTDEPSAADMAERATELGGKVRPDTKPKQFLAFAIWNYEVEKVQVFEFSQQSIANPLIATLSDEEVEAEPHLTDFKISASGSGLEKRYQVVSLAGRRRKPAIDSPITEAWDKAKADGFDISVLVSGGDPFKGTAF
jgi:hypothetical protein